MRAREENGLYPNSGRPTAHRNEEGAPSRGGRCTIESKMHVSYENIFLGIQSEETEEGRNFKRSEKMK